MHELVGGTGTAALEILAVSAVRSVKCEAVALLLLLKAAHVRYTQVFSIMEVTHIGLAQAQRLAVTVWQLGRRPPAVR